jgi:hypothetical protein
LLQNSVPKNDVVDRRRSDNFHQNVGLPVCFWERFKEWWDCRAISVVPTSFTLRLEDVAFAI